MAGLGLALHASVSFPISGESSVTEPIDREAQQHYDGSPKRELFGTRVGFILAAVGSAVGLGNMWRSGRRRNWMVGLRR